MFFVNWIRKKRQKLDKEKFQMKLFTFFTIKILIAFIIFAVIVKNYEFIYYGAVLLSLILIIYFIHRKIRLHLPIFILLCTVILMHTVGGLLRFNGIKLYDISFGIIKYDNIIHFLSAFTMVFIFYNLIYNFILPCNEKRDFYLFTILVLMTAGFGTMIEFIELFAVLFFDAEKAVGGYFNNVVDLLVNFIGASTASLLVVYCHRKKRFRGLLNNSGK